MSELALKLIKEAKEKRLTRLDLGNCGLTELPDELFELTWLEELNLLSNRELNNLNMINKLFNLKRLNLIATSIYNLNPLKNLNTLEELRISNSKVSDINPLQNLVKLQHLDLMNTGIIDISPLKRLTELQSINFSNTFTGNIKPVENLINLRFLSMSKTNVIDISPLLCLTNLECLIMTETDITDINPLQNLVNLKYLLMSDTKITDIKHLQNLFNLEELSISNTQISDLNPIKNLYELKRLSLRETLVNDLCPLKKLKKLEKLSYDGCPILSPPKSIARNGISSILRYLQELENKETITNNQTKFIFVGNSRAGKTSLWQFLKDKTYNDQADSTHGIKIEIWDTETLGTEDNQNLAAHIWDFGGQEYYHATHRLFLADNAVYVLVWEKDSNFQGTRPEKFKLDGDPNGEIEEVELEHFPASYWLENIEYFGGKHCPVLIVQNKVDSEVLKANYTDGMSEMSDCFHLSVQNAFGFQQGNLTLKRHDLRFQDFKERLLELLRKNATAFKLVKYYAQVREALETKAKNTEYIPVSELKDIALQFDETPDLENLLAYLKSFTNTVLYFSQNDVLKDRLYLNPTHISRDIYKILNKTVRENNGKFDMGHIQTRLNCDALEAERFVALMREFDLIFEKQDESGIREFITPQYLPEKDKLSKDIQFFIKRTQFETASSIQFKSFVPRSLMLRFIANNGVLSDGETYWRNGIIYESPVTNALIKVEYNHESLTFKIEVQDKVKQAIDMQNIVKQFVKLEDSDDNIKISNDGKTYIELRTIRKLQHENRKGDFYYEDNLVSLSEYEWLTQKQETVKSMTLKELKEKVLSLISKAKIKEAMEEIATWAHSQNQEQLKSDIALLKGDWSDLSREKTLGLISNSEASIRQNQLNNRVLNLLNGIEDNIPNSDTSGSGRTIRKSIEIPTDFTGEIVQTISTFKGEMVSNIGTPIEHKPKIYFSYAWGDDSETGESREKIVGDLYESLKEDGFEVFRDKEDSEYKDLISDMMKDIGRRQFIVVAISDKYLKSLNCMYEMYEIYRNSKLEKDKFIQKIYPIRVENISLSKPKVLAEYFKYWKEQENEWKDLIDAFGSSISPEQQIKYKRIKAIASELGVFLDLLSDINCRTKEDLSHNNFEEIKKAIKARVGVSICKTLAKRS